VPGTHCCCPLTCLFGAQLVIPALKCDRALCTRWMRESVQASAFSQPGNANFDLAKSKAIANFPIREPIKINGWTKVLSEGNIFPRYVYDEFPNHKKQLIRVEKTQLMYMDIYINSSLLSGYPDSKCFSSQVIGLIFLHIDHLREPMKTS